MPRKKESYESLIEKLEQIVGDMDNNELSLEKCMECYESGIKISNKLYKILNDAQGKINVLIENQEKEFINIQNELSDS